MVRASKSISPTAVEERKRIRSTEKEKRRNIDINKAFDFLQNQLPDCVPKSSRLPKIKTLRLALKYIEHLNAILNGKQLNHEYQEHTRPLSIDDFATVAMREIQVRNTYTDRVRDEQAKSRPEAQSSESCPMDPLPQMFNANAVCPVQFASFPTVPQDPCIPGYEIVPVSLPYPINNMSSGYWPM